MAYVINNYDGTPLVNIADKTVNTTGTSLSLPGKDYRPYGETMVENLVYLMQHFARSVPPANPIDGQIWYDTSAKNIRVYDDTTGSWLNPGKPQLSDSFPGSPQNGDLLYHTSKKQLFVYDNPSTTWKLIGPLGAQNGSNPTGAAPAITAVEAVQIPDTNSVLKQVIRVTVSGTLTAIIAKESFNAGLTGFPDPIQPGINIPSASSFNGQSTSALTSNDSLNLAGIPASQYMRLNSNNEPDLDSVRSLGTTTKKYASIHANQFVGNASTATFASTANTASVANTSSLLNGEPSSFYLNASNMATGTLPEARLPTGALLKSGGTMTGYLTLASTGPTDPYHAVPKQYVDSSLISVYESPPFNIANSGVYTYAHGLSGVPRFVTLDLVCVDPAGNGGYVTGDIIQISPTNDIAGVSEGTAIKKTATNVTIYIGNNGPQEYVRGDGSGGGIILTASKWQMIIRAYR